jgi:hypothetical protein
MNPRFYLDLAPSSRDTSLILGIEVAKPRGGSGPLAAWVNRLMGGDGGGGIRTLEPSVTVNGFRDHVEHADLQGIYLGCASAKRVGAREMN